ncbi:hypothetical protein [Streptomyces sp. NPDC096132]
MSNTNQGLVPARRARHADGQEPAAPTHVVPVHGAAVEAAAGRPS